MAESEVEVKLKATGADETAAGISKVEKSAEDLGKTTTSVAGTASKLKSIAAAAGAIGVATAAAAKTLGQVREALESIDTEQLRAVDSAMADNIDSAKNWATALEDPIGMLLKLTTGETIASAFEGLNEQLKLNAEMTTQAVDRFIEKGAIQVDLIKKQAADLKAANALLDAKADTAAAERDGKNAERIRNGEAPEDVAADEAKIQAAEKIARIEREQEESRVGLQAKFDAAAESRRNAESGNAASRRIDDAQAKFDAADDAMKTDNFTSLTTLEERKDAARKELEAVKIKDGVAAAATKANEAQAEANLRAYNEQREQIEKEDELANQRKATVRVKADNKVTDLGSNKSERLAAEKLATKAKADAAAAKVAADALRDSQLVELEGKRTKLAGTAAGNQAKIQGGGKKAGGLQDIGKDIGNADTEAEIAAVGEQIRAKQGELGAVTVAALKQMLEGQAALVREIAVIRQQIKNR